MRRSLIVAAMAALLLMASLAPAGAAPPSDVTFEVAEDFVGTPVPFVASGPAVTEGLICVTGLVDEDSGKVTGENSPTGFNWLGIKHFICDDGSGEFFMRMQARIFPDGDTTFHWVVVGGTGAYVDLHGAGSGFGLGGFPCGDPNVCILDVYEGRLH